MATKIFSIWRFIVNIFSAEWLITKLEIPNGGPVVLFRAIWSSSFLFLLYLGTQNALDPMRGWEFSFAELRLQSSQNLHWYGVIFAGMYTALYTRFSSQWSYLAEVYNAIKASEAGGGNAEVLAEWKAGFLEDAENLHIACKGTVVSIVMSWGRDELVRQAFINHTPGGETRYNRLMERAEFSTTLVHDKYTSA